MEIAWFTDTWLPNRDGVVTSLLLFKKILEKKGHNIYIFAPGNENEREEEIFYYASKPFSKYPNYRITPVRTIFSARTKKLIKEISPDVIHSHSPGIIGLNAVIPSYKFRIPLIFTYHTFLNDSLYLIFKGRRIQHIGEKLLYIWLRWYFRRCSCIITPSNYVANEIKKFFDGDIKVLPNGIEIDFFEKGNGEKIRRKYEGKKIILHVGRIVREKNIDLLIKSAPLVLKKYDTIFIIVGEGPARRELEEKVKGCGLKDYFIFTGFVSDEELADYYKSADVFVFPSTYETQGIVAFEAMSAGLPVVGAKAKAIPEFIKDGVNGYLSSPYDEKEFAEKIFMALENKGVGNRGKEFVKKYSIEKMADSLIKIYEEYAR
ncbi:MAG TPA: glycosyltransferase family 4 protein [Thermoplasmatales archaeon]|nr:glycosyltransferase family 4 protein [Thermoplasmatales archaeon]